MDDATIPNVLALDIGNTSIDLAMVAGEDVTDIRKIPANEPAALEAAIAELWLSTPEPRRIVACSVNPTAADAADDAVRQATDQTMLLVGRDLPLPMATALESPESIGADRVCSAVAAYDRLGAACVVADFGTAVTLDAVNDEGVFLGGAILPGLALASAALAGNTALLPPVEPAEPEGTFGQTTPEAIRHGVFAAVRGALKDRTEAYATELGNWPIVIATGGDAAVVIGDVLEHEFVQAIVPDLTLRGVAMAYYHAMTLED
jgi:type III pantothenate kinase